MYNAPNCLDNRGHWVHKFEVKKFIPITDKFNFKVGYLE